MARAARRTSGGTNDIRVRMYNVGFGDCFLLLLPGPDRLLRVVIDCGSIKEHDYKIKQISDQLIEDCRNPDGTASIDVLVMSHRHRDHISGFTNPAWKEVHVKEIWMPWVESDTANARRFRAKFFKAGAALEIALKQIAKLGVSVRPGLMEIALNAKSNEDSLKVLHEGFAGNAERLFFPASKDVIDKKKAVERIDSKALPGIDIFVMGPPYDDDAIKDEEKKSETLHLGFSEDAGEIEKFAPFGTQWVTKEVGLNTERMDRSVALSSMIELLAAKADKGVNNTSLILLFRVGKEYLLFPGDAQWGPWEKVLADEEALDLLSKVTFLKVGHHASHNASPKTLFRNHIGEKNDRNRKVYAMISMTPHGAYQSIPHEPLIEELDKQGFPFVNSHDGKIKPNTGFSKGGGGMWFDFKFP